MVNPRNYPDPTAPVPPTPAWVVPSPQPHTCPVCKGVGQVPSGFYNGEMLGENTGATCQCRSCSGSGVVWG